MRQQYSNVFLVGSSEDLTPLEEVLTRNAAVTKAKTTHEAIEQLGKSDCDVLFCLNEMADGSWRDLLREIQKQRLRVPVVVADRTGNMEEWIEVLEAGGFDLLAPPYGDKQILAVLEHASESANRKACINA